jgi:hypothetical protein
MKAGEWLYLCVAHGNDGAMEVSRQLSGMYFSWSGARNCQSTARRAAVAAKAVASWQTAARDSPSIGLELGCGIHLHDVPCLCAHEAGRLRPLMMRSGTDALSSTSIVGPIVAEMCIAAVGARGRLQHYIHT